MKTTRLILAIIYFIILLLPNQAGSSRGFSNSNYVQATDHKNPLYINEKQNWLPIVGNPDRSTSVIQTGSCHFGITALGSTGYDLSILGVDSYLDWGQGQKDSSVADNIQYYRVINVSDALYDGNLQGLQARLSAYPGSVWIIGNEPDAEVTYQDHISAVSYGYRFRELAKTIRTNDPSAKIGFGPVIMPTPVRLHYLDLAIEEMTRLENGDRASALALIDIYTIHAFLLNEHPVRNELGETISWGAGVPLGYNPITWPPYQEILGDQTYDINLFIQRVTAFRAWMNALGPLERSKPLWITEYGSLFPTWLDVSDLTTAAYMEQTFDFMLGTKVPSLGNPSDENRLVQKWLWYSLNDNIDHYGGSLYNPLTHELTAVGDHFINYDPLESAVLVTNPDVTIQMGNPVVGMGPSGSNYKISLKLSNYVSSDRLTPVQVELFLGSTPVGTLNTNLPRCAGRIPVSFILENLVAGANYTFTARVSLTSTGQTDINSANNEITFQPTIPVLYAVMVPLISR